MLMTTIIITLILWLDSFLGIFIMPVLHLPQATINYLDIGAGEPLLLLSANPGTHNDFAAIIPHLANHFRVLALDWAGYGESILHIHPNKVSVSFYLETLEAFIEQLNLSSLRLIGNSLGGNVAARYAIKHPNQVKALVLVSTGGFTPHNLITRAFCRWQGSRWAIPPALFARFYLRRRNSIVTEMLSRAANEQSEDKQRQINQAVWRSFLDPDHDLRPIASQLTTPTLLIFGRYDPVISAWIDGQVAKRYLPSAKMVILACGHAPFAEMADDFLHTIQPFLALSNSETILDVIGLNEQA